MRVLNLICVLAIIGSQYFGGEVPKTVQVFWIPPEVETYVPVTAENVERMAFKIVQIKNEKQADELIRLVQESNQPLDSKRIRIKISTDGKSYVFDSNGRGISSSREAVKIDLKSLKRVLCE